MNDAIYTDFARIHSFSNYSSFSPCKEKLAFLYESTYFIGKNPLSPLSLLFPCILPVHPLPEPYPLRMSPYKLHTYRYGEYTKNIRRNYDPDRVQTKGENEAQIGR